MYTTCPECDISFRVTAKVLQQANGNVRCGGCEHVFNALDYLSEEMPQPSEKAGASSDPDPLAETSRRLLKTLDELAGPDEVRIEDTGVEWRVLDNDDPDSISGEFQAIEEMRYDDSTLLPENFGRDDAEHHIPFEPARRETDFSAHGSEEFDELQGDLALSEPDEWTDLLEEVRDRGTEAEALELEEELADIHNQLSARHESAPATVTPADLESQFYTQAEAMGLDLPASELALTDEVPLLDEAVFEGFADPDEFDGDDAEVADDAEAADDAEDVDDAEEADEHDDADDEFSDDDDEDSSGDPEGESTDAIDPDPVADNFDDALHDDEHDAEADELETDDLDPVAEELDEDEDPVESDDEESCSVEADEGEEVSESAEPRESTGEFEAQIEKAARSLDGGHTGENEIAPGQPADTEPLRDEDSAEVLHIVPPPTEEEMTVNMEIDQEMMALAIQDDKFAATLVGIKSAEELFSENAADVESIVMEGESIRGTIELEELAAQHADHDQFAEPANLVDTYALRRGGRRKQDPASRAVTATIVVLALALIGQIVHNSRESLATIGLFNQAVAPIYRMLGNPVTPAWDIRGWQFESTSGSVDDSDQALTIVSRIVNRADQPLPYPLVHVSLTDRWEDIMGTRVLEPGEYLAGDLDPSSPVLPGENFTAVITIEDPSTEATGFKLNVCYRVAPGTVRCAIEDFKP